MPLILPIADGVPVVQAYMEYMPIMTPTAANSINTSGSIQPPGLNSTAGNSSVVCGGLADIYRTFTFGRTMTLVSQPADTQAQTAGQLLRLFQHHCAAVSSTCCPCNRHIQSCCYCMAPLPSARIPAPPPGCAWLDVLYLVKAYSSCDGSTCGLSDELGCS